MKRKSGPELLRTIIKNHKTPNAPPQQVSLNRKYQQKLLLVTCTLLHLIRSQGSKSETGTSTETESSVSSDLGSQDLERIDAVFN